MKRPMTFTFEQELLDRLKKLSEETEVPQSRLISKALKEFLDRRGNK